LISRVPHGVFYWLAIQLSVMGLVFYYGGASKLNQFFLHEALLLLAIVMIRGRISPRVMVAAATLAVMGSWLEVYNHLHKYIVEVLDLGIYRPQDAAWLFGSFILLSFWVMVFTKKGFVNVSRIGAAIIAHAAYIYWIFLHLVLLFPQLDALTDRNLEKLKAEIMRSDFLQACEYRRGEPVEELVPTRQKWSCYEGGSKDEMPEWATNIAGMQGIYERAMIVDERLTWAWLTNWAGKSNIDVPFKSMVYTEYRGRHRIILDWNQYQMDKAEIVKSAGYLFSAFSLVWTFGGMMLLMFHEIRISRRTAGAQS
jgi:hypothetical protein